MPSAKSSYAYRIHPEVLHRDVEGQTLLLLPGEHALFTLNDTGRFVWRGLAKGWKVTTLVQRLANEFGVDEAVAEEDVTALLDDLARRGIIELKAP